MKFAEFGALRFGPSRPCEIKEVRSASLAQKFVRNNAARWLPIRSLLNKSEILDGDARMSVNLARLHRDVGAPGEGESITFGRGVFDDLIWI